MDLVPLDQIPFSAFAEQVGAVFGVVLPAGETVELNLTSVSGLQVLESPGKGGKYESFSVFFEGPGSVCLAQGTWVLRNERVGALELFMVPIGNEGGRFQYQAAFNRVR